LRQLEFETRKGAWDADVSRISSKIKQEGLIEKEKDLSSYAFELISSTTQNENILLPKKY